MVISTVYLGMFACSSQSQAARHVVLWSDFAPTSMHDHLHIQQAGRISEEYVETSTMHIFPIFGLLNKALKSQRFHSDSKVTDTV
ncbi:hypothetical protein CEXT_6281 [Caerostris extrusa]|uniref:Secreted protein n=1 Tax=Caerostris extrusa TaxID=172846 RepID=A0AAV4PKD9_CAEEX|nr:hypothetical protein CEXT_6281 [Caerostris extrusa]